MFRKKGKRVRGSERILSTHFPKAFGRQEILYVPLLDFNNMERHYLKVIARLCREKTDV